MSFLSYAPSFALSPDWSIPQGGSASNNQIMRCVAGDVRQARSLLEPVTKKHTTREKPKTSDVQTIALPKIRFYNTRSIPTLKKRSTQVPSVVHISTKCFAPAFPAVHRTPRLVCLLRLQVQQPWLMRCLRQGKRVCWKETHNEEFTKFIHRLNQLESWMIFFIFLHCVFFFPEKPLRARSPLQHGSADVFPASIQDVILMWCNLTTNKCRSRVWVDFLRFHAFRWEKNNKTWHIYRWFRSSQNVKLDESLSRQSTALCGHCGSYALALGWMPWVIGLQRNSWCLLCFFFFQQVKICKNHIPNNTRSPFCGGWCVHFSLTEWPFWGVMLMFPRLLKQIQVLIVLVGSLKPWDVVWFDWLVLYRVLLFEDLVIVDCLLLHGVV